MSAITLVALRIYSITLLAMDVILLIYTNYGSVINLIVNMILISTLFAAKSSHKMAAATGRVR